MTFKIGTPVAALLGAWCYRLSAGTYWPEARCLPLSESEVKRGSYVIPKYSLCNGSKDES